jgi:hypothetical protein
MILARAMIGSNITIQKLLTLLPVIAGVGFTTYGDYYFTFWGLVLTLFGTFLAALKTVVTNMLQSGSGGRLKLHPLDLLMRMSPLAFIQCVSVWMGERGARSSAEVWRDGDGWREGSRVGHQWVHRVWAQLCELHR